MDHGLAISVGVVLKAYSRIYIGAQIRGRSREPYVMRPGAAPMSRSVSRVSACCFEERDKGALTPSSQAAYRDVTGTAGTVFSAT
jgi:hypothetical protein